MENAALESSKKSTTNNIRRLQAAITTPFGRNKGTARQANAVDYKVWRNTNTRKGRITVSNTTGIHKKYHS
jgi:hypothetical protein